MKNILLHVLAVACATLTFHSCSVEKRHYMPGYHIEWKHKADTENTKAAEPATGTAYTPNTVTAGEKTATGETAVTMPAEKPAGTAAEIAPAAVSEKPVAQQNKGAATKKTKTKNENRLAEATAQKLEKAGKKIANVVRIPAVSATAMDETAALVIGIILLVFGLHPFAVLVVLGTGREFSLDLTFWLVGILFLVLAVAIGSSAFWAIGAIFLLISLVYALVVIIQSI